MLLEQLFSGLMMGSFYALIALGFVLVRQRGSMQGWLTDPQVVATLLTWALYAVLVHMRANAGRHGQGIALVTVLGFCCVLLIFVGVYALAATAHGSTLSAMEGIE